MVALLAGAAVGILLAPRSGKATRQKFSKDSDAFLKDLQETISAGFNNIRRQYEETKDDVVSRYNDAVDTVGTRSKKVAERAERNSKY